MSAQAMTARLSRIDPFAFAGSVRQRMTSYLRDGLAIPVSDGGDRCFQVAHDAAAFAKGEVEDPAVGQAAIEALESMLYARPADGQVCRVHHDALTDAGVVLEAARCRLKLSRKQAVSCIELAALASVAGSMVRTALQEGVLAREHRPQRARRQEDAPILASYAIKWLSSRGVKGFAKGGTSS